MLERFIAVAYFGDFVRDEEKSFLAFATGKRSSLFRLFVIDEEKKFYDIYHILKTFFSSSLTVGQNKLECLSLASLLSLVYYLKVRLGAYPYSVAQ
jgi:hypothetical protein